MILGSQTIGNGLNGNAGSSESQTRAETFSLKPPLDLIADVASRYKISALSGLAKTTRSTLNQEGIAVAVLGRFKAGKSSFLNDFMRRLILPVGVVPVTATVTEVRYGPRERAAFLAPGAGAVMAVGSFHEVGHLRRNLR